MAGSRALLFVDLLPPPWPVTPRCRTPPTGPTLLVAALVRDEGEGDLDHRGRRRGLDDDDLPDAWPANGLVFRDGAGCLPAGDAALRAVEVSEDAQPRAVPCVDEDQEVGVGGRADGRRQTVSQRVERLRRVAAGDAASAEMQPSSTPG